MTKFRISNHRAAKRTPSEIIEMRRLYAEEGWSQGQLARHFQMSVGQVGRIVRGESWSEYHNFPTEQELEHRAAIAPPIDSAELAASLARLAGKLNSPEPPSEGDPLEEMLRRRGGADPLARQTGDSQHDPGTDPKDR